MATNHFYFSSYLFLIFIVIKAFNFSASGYTSEKCPTQTSNLTGTVSDSILDRYVGRWEVVNQSAKAEWTPESDSSIFKQNANYKLQGKLLEISTISNGIELYELMQLDPERSRYERWLFDSNGNGSNWIGNWDPSTNSMKWTLQTCGYLENERKVKGEIIETFTTDNRYEKTLKIKTDTGDDLVNIKSIHQKLDSGN